MCMKLRDFKLEKWRLYYDIRSLLVFLEYFYIIVRMKLKVFLKRKMVKEVSMCFV